MRSRSTITSSFEASPARTNGSGITYSLHGISDEEWDAVALGYGEGTAALVLLERLEHDEWQAEAKEIAANVEAGCKVLFERAHKKGAAPESATTK
jgi:hypothetical protein